MDFGSWLPSGEFLNTMFTNPVLLIAVLLTLAGVFVNGWTDAPNSIATCVASRCMRPRAALLMSAFFDFLGVFVMSVISGKVADTMAKMLDFGSDKHVSMVALCAGLVAVVVWAVVAWAFGLPSSQSHSLIAGISGAAIAAVGSFSAINFGEWKKVIYGLAVSIVVGALLGFIYTRGIGFLFRRADRRKLDRPFKLAQIGSGAFMSFMHGAQDGQKFIAIMFIAACLTSGKSTSGVAVPYWMMLAVALIMALGSAFCSERIIKSVGMDMVKMERYEAFSADFAGATCVLIATLTGLPISTTHAKTAAIMGTGASKRLTNVNWGLSKRLIYSWFIVFPFCGAIGYGLTWLALRIF